jgi:glycosyltransferase involved in cell wall biosynthesis
VKLLIVQNYWTPYRNYLFHELAAQPGIELEVLYLGAVGADRKWRSQNADFKVIQATSRRLGPFVISDLSDLSFDTYDAVILLEHLENIFSILKIARRSKGRYILWSGMFEDMYPDKPSYGRAVSFFKKLYRSFLYRARHYLAYSSLTRAMFEANGVPAERITVMPQVARIESIPAIEGKRPEEYRRDRRGPLQVLSLGYLRPEKNNLSLARVCRRFSSDQLHLTIVGDGPQAQVLREEAGENVEVLDYLEGTAKFEKYLASDVFVLPTVRDPWGLVVNEAMYYGLPVICSERAGAKDAIDGNGFVYDPFDEEALYRHIDFFVRNRDQVTGMGRRSREIIETKYSAEHAIATLKEVLHKVGVL